MVSPKQMQGFQDILPGSKRRVFTTFVPNNAKLFLIYETDKTTGEDVPFYWKDEAKQWYSLHRFDATSSVQKCTPSKPQSIQKYGKLGPFIDIHNVWVKIVSRPGYISKICEIFPETRKFIPRFLCRRNARQPHRDSEW
jgi:hypothetical protein